MHLIRIDLRSSQVYYEWKNAIICKIKCNQISRITVGCYMSFIRRKNKKKNKNWYSYWVSSVRADKALYNKCSFFFFSKIIINIYDQVFINGDLLQNAFETKEYKKRNKRNEFSLLTLFPRKGCCYCYCYHYRILANVI